MHSPRRSNRAVSCPVAAAGRPPNYVVASTRASQAAAAPHLVILAACASILVLAMLLTPAPDTESSLRIGGRAVPNLCVMKQASGLPCPGCGLTRSVVAAANADWAGSLSHHRIGILVLVYLALQSLTRIAWLSLPSLREKLARYCRVLDLSLIPILILMFFNWIPTLLGVLSAHTTL